MKAFHDIIRSEQGHKDFSSIYYLPSTRGSISTIQKIRKGQSSLNRSINSKSLDMKSQNELNSSNRRKLDVLLKSNELSKPKSMCKKQHIKAETTKNSHSESMIDPFQESISKSASNLLNPLPTDSIEKLNKEPLVYKMHPVAHHLEINGTLELGEKLMKLNPHRKRRVSRQILEKFDNVQLAAHGIRHNQNNESLLSNGASNTISHEAKNIKRRNSPAISNSGTIFSHHRRRLPLVPILHRSPRVSHKNNLLLATELDFLKSMHAKERVEVSRGLLIQISKSLEGFILVDEWVKTLEGRRPQMSSLLFKRLASTYSKTSMDKIAPLFFDESFNIKKVHELQATQLLKQLFTLKEDLILMDKDKKMIHSLTDQMTHSPNSLDLLDELTKSKFFTFDEHQLNIFPHVANVFLLLLTEAKCMYFAHLSDTANKKLQMCIDNTTNYRFFTNQQSLQDFTRVRNGTDPDQVFLKAIRRGLGTNVPSRKLIWNNGNKESERICLEERMFNSKLHEILVEMRDRCEKPLQDQIEKEKLELAAAAASASD